ncbi:MAG: hypothetical protein H7240_08885 [Glaciimonas sp.]|nr:hypothetical protein [Glaciimonas sp.]
MFEINRKNFEVILSKVNSPILGYLVLIAFATSFLYPGSRIGGLPVSPFAILGLLFAPWVTIAYGRARGHTTFIALGLLLALITINSLVYELEIRDAQYLLIPISSVGAVVMMKVAVDQFGINKVLNLGLLLCTVNVLVMLGQASNFFDMNNAFASLLINNIEFVTSNDVEKDILLTTLPIRPPGFFPSGIFASTVIYIVCRASCIYKKVFWPMSLAFLAIMVSANRTLAIVFIFYELAVLLVSFGFIKFFKRIFIGFVVAAAILFGIFQTNSDLYVFQFLTLGSNFDDIRSSASIIERLKTFEIFVENLPRHGLFGGYSSSALINSGHVFDSELMLRILQFGIVGVICLAYIILLPRSGKFQSSWFFLIFLTFVASLSTTVMTSIVYVGAIALYKEMLIRKVIHDK